MGNTVTRLAGKYAIITGATTGIGKAIAIRFAQEGANVAVNCRSVDKDAEAALAEVQAASSADSGTRHILVQGDVSKENEVQAMFRNAIADFGSLDILVNNAGIQKPAASEEVEMEDFDRVLNVNLRGAFLCAREALSHFLQRNKPGVILNNSSVHELIPKPKYVPYSISKGGLENMTKTLALEYASRGIRVNAVGPGAIITPINDAWTNDPKAKAEVESHIPMGRAGRAEEIAAVFAFLASEDASYITGQTLFACGGLTLYPEFRVAWSSGE
ncbi:MAG: glucose 1-dehydrogenase [Bryobacteraceae bacterium]|nr:glucose 1-dehydrogenase [Bryobacteraceae bacterium]